LRTTVEISRDDLFFCVETASDSSRPRRFGDDRVAAGKIQVGPIAFVMSAAKSSHIETRKE
jgi:hypothetical protein